MKDKSFLASAYIKERPVDSARVLESLPLDDSAAFLESISPQDAAMVLGSLMPWFASQCLNKMKPESAAEMLQILPSYRSALLLKALDRPARVAILGCFTKSKNREARKQMIYPANTLGAWMDTFIPSVPEEATVEESLVLARNLSDHLAHHLCVVNREGVFRGGVAISKLISTSNEVRVTEILDPLYVSLPVQATLASVKWHSGWNQNAVLPIVNFRNQIEGLISHKRLREGLGEVDNQGMVIESFLSGLIPMYTSCLTLFTQTLAAIPYKQRKPGQRNR
ncbi:MAG: magnesium transporter [Candidatus Nitronauta litoralis]|uniref:Magnesium transporter n=1 Tax=Candidatus Nitronauta litoralis TaxID=2705533 RepID=A0A7T0BXL7_9BACT|nr:MAG: magnesium transporter [Candidatus Nitronauta litoralis]